MRWYIHAIHNEDQHTDTFVIWAETRVNAPRTAWKQRGYTFTQLIEHVRKMSFTARKNTYLSLQTFLAPFRRAETLFTLNAIAFDIDAHSAQNPTESIADALYLPKS